MRLSKEILVLLLLLLATMGFVLWYVADRKAKQRVEENRPVPTATTHEDSSTTSSSDAAPLLSPKP